MANEGKRDTTQDDFFIEKIIDRNGLGILNDY